MKFCSKLECSNPVFGGGFCSWHQYMREDKKQKPIVRKKLIQASTKWPLNRLSDKYKKALAIYKGKRLIFLIENPTCQAAFPGCSKEATQVHHKKGRIGGLLIDPEFWLSVCDYCHKVIEANPRLAKEKGFSVSRLAKEEPELIPQQNEKL